MSVPTTPVSPSNPNFLYQASPPPTRQVLQDVAANLRPIEAIQSVVPNWPPLESEVTEEVVNEGHIVEEAQNLKLNDGIGSIEVRPPQNRVRMVNFDVENGDDDNRALQEACSNLKNVTWDDNDVPFFFAQAETRMRAVGAKKQYTKFQAMATILPKKVLDECKELLVMQEDEFTNNDSYKQLKTTVLQIFGPRPETAIDRALGRVLAGKPSQLARALVRDICKKQLKDCTCCPAVVLALWKRQLSSQVRAGIAHCVFNANTFNEVTQLADSIAASHQTQPSVAAVSLDETQPALPYPQPEVAATSRGGRGRGRGRGGRGRGNRGGRGGASTASGTQGGTQTKHKGTKHPDLPDGDWQGCSMHFKHGKSAYFCAEPSTCPWKNVYIPKPQ